MSNTLSNESYTDFIKNLKQEISKARIGAYLAVNKELIVLYWNIGKFILERQNKEKWESKVIQNISDALRKEFPKMKGLSYQNLSYMRQFFAEYNDQILQQAVGEIPWSHNIIILSKLKNINQRIWYAQQTIENGWSRNVLSLQIKSNLHERSAKGINNFSNTLPKLQSDLARSIIKDPYNLEFLDIQGKIIERDLENKLIDNIKNFLLELGQGLAFVGNQYHIELEGEDYYLDLVFYQIKLKCYVVIELKTGKFKPGYAGKLNFYLNLMERTIKDNSDNPTIGLILCEEKQGITVEYAIEGIQKPIGVSEFKLTATLPKKVEKFLPTPQDLATLKSE
ncbi:MAG: YhcG family protein [Rickettsia endosymbiont of Haemaphysalis japonica]